MKVDEIENLTAETVADYLSEHPDFFTDRPKLVDSLKVPHQEQGTISLVELQLKRQRQRVEDLEEEVTMMMGLATKNDRTFQQLMALQQALLVCESLPKLERLIQDYSNKIGLKSHLLLLDQGILLDTATSSWHLEQETHQRFMTNHLNGKDAYLGRLNRNDRHALFGHDRFKNDELAELGSYVILPLKSSESLGLIAFSSQEGGHFQPDMDTLFLRHLAALVSFLIRSFNQKHKVDAQNQYKNQDNKSAHEEEAVVVQTTSKADSEQADKQLNCAVK